MRSGIDLTHGDDSIRPQDDLFGHVNGTWYRTVDIPADRGRYGSFDRLRERAEHDLHAIVTEVSAAEPDPATPAGKVATLFGSFMDLERIQARGRAPLDEILGRVDALASLDDLIDLVGWMDRVDLPTVWRLVVTTDDRDSSRYIIYVDQGGLGLPDESYYREERHAAVRAAYPGHIERMLRLAGRPDAAGAAERIVALETRLATSHLDVVADRDAVATYHLTDAAGLRELLAVWDFSRYAETVGAAESAFAEVIVRQPEFLRGLQAALTEVPLSTWREWLSWNVIRGLAPFLTEDFVTESFDFYGRTLSGTPQQRDRWKRGVDLVDRMIGDALGELYVAKHFPPAAKERMAELVDNLVEAFRRSFTDRPWMGEQTRQQALDKLEAFTPKVGYPVRWKDYTGLDLGEDIVDNVLAASAHGTDRQLAKLGQPVDRDEWFMTPQTVNAYYNPGMNEIVFPAGILQPPFFDVESDDAVNYGGIGAVIGHEIGHGFDDQGSQFDGTGNLRNWWTDEDRQRFDALSRQLIEQFNSLAPAAAPDARVNGALTVGENIGDLAGLGIGHAAYRISLGDTEAPEIDGYTGDQRFFVGWAQVWCGKAREETARMLLAVDPHSPAEHRANAARNLDAFHAAFGVREGDGMWLAPQDRVSIF